MKLIIVSLALIAVLAVFVEANVADVQHSESVSLEEVPQAEEDIARVGTCSPWEIPGACTAHCKLLGKKGGRCVKKTCVCYKK